MSVRKVRSYGDNLTIGEFIEKMRTEEHYFDYTSNIVTVMFEGSDQVCFCHSYNEDVEYFMEHVDDIDYDYTDCLGDEIDLDSIVDEIILYDYLEYRDGSLFLLDVKEDKFVYLIINNKEETQDDNITHVIETDMTVRAVYEEHDRNWTTMWVQFEEEPEVVRDLEKIEVKYSFYKEPYRSVREIYKDGKLYFGDTEEHSEFYFIRSKGFDTNKYKLRQYKGLLPSILHDALF